MGDICTEVKVNNGLAEVVVREVGFRWLWCLEKDFSTSLSAFADVSAIIYRAW